MLHPTRTRWRLALASTTIAALTALAGVAAATPAAAATRAPLLTSAAAIDGSYIVMLKSGTKVEAAVAKLLSVLPKAVVTQTYSALGGFAANLTPAQVAVIRQSPLVEFVEQDSVMTTQETWGLDRIDQPSLPLDNSYTQRHGRRACAPTSSTPASSGRTPTSRARVQRLHLDQRRAGHRRLQRPRHACRGHGRQQDVRRGEVGAAHRGAGARLRGLGLHLRRHRRHELGGDERQATRGREHEPRRHLQQHRQRAVKRLTDKGVTSRSPQATTTFVVLLLACLGGVRR